LQTRFPEVVRLKHRLALLALLALLAFKHTATFIAGINSYAQ